MPTDCKIRSLLVRPSRSVDLSFDMPGIIDYRQDQLIGQTVKAYSLRHQLYPLLETDTNAKSIRQNLKNVALFSLRNDDIASVLEQLILEFKLAQLEVFSHKDEIRQILQEIHLEDPANTNTQATKMQLLQKFRNLSSQRWNTLNTAYGQDWVEPIKDKETSSVSNVGTQETTTFIRPMGTEIGKYSIEVSNPQSTHTVSAVMTKPIAQTMDDQGNISDWKMLEKSANANHEQQRTTTKYIDHGQRVRAKFVEYRTPKLDSEIRHVKTEIDLLNSRYNDSMLKIRAREIGEILQTQEDLAKNEIRKVQVALSQSFLVPPFTGLITTVYKEHGEYVKAGEPVLRLENSGTVLLLGVIQYRGLLSIGGKVTIIASNLAEGGLNVFIPGTIVSIRGHNSDDDEWDVIISASNTGLYGENESGEKVEIKLPINYHFDRQTTVIKV